MKVQPVSSPHAMAQPQSSQTSSRSKAIEAFNKATISAQSPQQSPHSAQINQNAISPEDLSAIQAPSQGQEESIEDTSSEAIEVPQEAKPAPTEAELAASRQYAQLARQEKALRQKAQHQEKALEAREAAVRAKEAELSAKGNTPPAGYYSKDQIKQNILSVMAETGVSYDEVVQQLISQPQIDPRMDAQLSALRAEIKSLKDAQDTSVKSQQEQQQQAYDSAVQQIRNDVSNLVKSDEAYETIRTARAQKDVVELITETYKKDGILLTVEEAAQEVENYLVDEALKFTRLEKIQKRLKAATPAPSKPIQQTQANQKQPQPMKTLTNATSSSRQLSAKERAVLAFKGELKS